METINYEQFKRVQKTMLRKQPKKRDPSPGEESLAKQLTALKISFVREYRFYQPYRQWRFDFALMEHKIAIEVEGGIWVKGGHTRGKHFEEDCVKYNTATMLGWKVLRFSTGQVTKGEAVRFLTRIKTLGLTPQEP